MFDNDSIIKESIRRAEAGDPDEARSCLDGALTAIHHGQIDSPYLVYLAKKLELYLKGDDIETALGIKKIKKGGRPIKHNEDEVSSIDLLLRDHAGMKPEAAIEWIVENEGSDRRAIQKLRKEFDSRYNTYAVNPLKEAFDRDLLLDDLSAEMREKVSEVLPHTKD